VVLRIAFVMWLGFLGLAMLAVGLEALTGSDLGCEAKAGDSNYGQAGWSWLPLGSECTWTQQGNGFDGHEEPGWGLTAYVGVVLVAGVGIGIGYSFVRHTRARGAFA
jgi:hypothetical protein